MATPRTNTMITTAAYTATQTSPVVVNDQLFNSARFFIDMTAVTATGSIVFDVMAYDSTSAKYVSLLTSAAVTAVSTVMLEVSPRLTASANLIAQKGLGSRFAVKATHGNGVAMTYTVSYDAYIA